MAVLEAVDISVHLSTIMQRQRCPPFRDDTQKTVKGLTYPVLVSSRVSYIPTGNKGTDHVLEVLLALC